MPDLRLSGGVLATARHLSRLGPVRNLLWQVGKADFDLDALRGLPPEARVPLDPDNAPLPGRAPHTWSDAGHDPPTATRPTCRTLHDAFLAGRNTPRDVLEQVLTAVAEGGPGALTFSPFVTLDTDRARAAADAATDRFVGGQPLGPLDGVPIPLKDEVWIEGLPTRGGTSYRDTVATQDAWVTARLRDAGAVLPGSAYCTEWGLNPYGANMHHSMPRNAWSADHAAGGSSTGPGAAVGIGLAPVALGSDGGGSIRIPACLNGVFGLKPTWIRIGRTGDDWGAGTMPHLGPIAGSTTDLVDFLAATAGVDPDDPCTLHAPDRHDVVDAWQAALGRGVKGCRIGVDEALWADAAPGVQQAGRDALDALFAAGAVRVDLSLPIARHAPAVGALIIASETLANVSDDLARHGDAFGHELFVILRMLSALPAQDLLMARRTRGAMRRELAAAFRDDIDLLAMPTTLTPAPRYARAEDRRDVLWTAATAAMTRPAFLANLTGLPAGTAPVGRVDGLPVGLQLVGDAWDEASVIAALATLERLGLTDLGRPDGFVVLGA